MRMTTCQLLNVEPKHQGCLLYTVLIHNDDIYKNFGKNGYAFLMSTNTIYIVCI